MNLRVDRDALQQVHSMQDLPIPTTDLPIPMTVSIQRTIPSRVLPNSKTMKARTNCSNTSCSIPTTDPIHSCSRATSCSKNSIRSSPKKS